MTSHNTTRDSGRMRLRNLFKPKKPLSGWLQVPMWVKIRASVRDVVSLGLCAGKNATASVSFMHILSTTTRAEVTATASHSAPAFHAHVVHNIGQHRLEVHFRVCGFADSCPAMRNTVSQLLYKSLNAYCYCSCDGQWGYSGETCTCTAIVRF